MANLPVPVPRTFTVGEYETGAYFNASIRDTTNFLLALPVATVFQTAGQSLPSANASVAVAFDSTAIDAYGGHSNTVNNSRYTTQVSGWYAVGGCVVFTASSSGTYRKVQIYANGTAVAYAAAQIPPVGSATFVTTIPISPTIVYLNAGDFVSLYATADVASFSTFASSSNQSYMTVFWVHN